MIALPAFREQTQRIAIFRALHLGDMLEAVPALRAIRAGFPGAEITLIGLPWAKSFVQRFHRYIDRFVEFAGFPGIEEQPYIPEQTARFFEEQQAYRYDLAIQMHGSGQASNRLICSLSARISVGYFVNRHQYELTLAAPYPHDEPEVYRNLGLARLLGCAQLDPRLEFPLFMSDYAEASRLLNGSLHIPRPWIGLHVGARAPTRRWPLECFAAVADELARLFDAQIILTGSADERSSVQTMQEYMTTRPINLAGKTPLGALAALIDTMDLFISNDTGPAHIAYALDTPSITIFGPADYRRWAPLNKQRHRVVRHAVPCSPCGYWDCPIDHRCLRGVTPESVIAAAKDLLATGVAV